MKITKLGHCCMVIEENGLRILTDPGAYTTEQNDVKNINVILITHEHQDHLHVDSLQTVLANNPGATIVTNTAVAKIIKDAGINVETKIVEHEQKTEIQNISFEAFGEKHAPIYLPIIPVVQNTGYLIAKKLFYPGDALTIPNAPVDILALPIDGTWIKISESLDYAKTIKPRVCFPVHDGLLKVTVPYMRTASLALPPAGIAFTVLELGKEIEL